MNAGNDLADLIRNECVGQVCESHQIEELVQLADDLLMQVDTDADLPHRCHALFNRHFSSERVVTQILESLSLIEAKVLV